MILTAILACDFRLPGNRIQDYVGHSGAVLPWSAHLYGVRSDARNSPECRVCSSRLSGRMEILVLVLVGR